VKAQDLHRALLGIDDPVLGHAVLGVHLALETTVALPVGRREHLDKQIRHTIDPLLHDARVPCRHKDHVGLHDVTRGQMHVDGSDKELAAPPSACPMGQGYDQVPDGTLVRDERRGGQDRDLAADQLGSDPFGQRHEVADRLARRLGEICHAFDPIQDHAPGSEDGPPPSAAKDAEGSRDRTRSVQRKPRSQATGRAERK
jgi:hypothetical protein